MRAYRAARDTSAPAADFDALAVKVRAARARAKRRVAEPGFDVLAQQRADVGAYIKRFKPADDAPVAAPRALAAEVEQLRAGVATLHAGELAARGKAILRRIEEARARAPERDEDHDAYVDVEEALGALGVFASDD